MNKTLLLGPESAAILGTDRIRPDFYIEDAATAGEYKSKAFHSSDDWANDSRRLDALESMGLHTFEQLAKEAGAIYKIRRVVLVNLDIFDEYLDTFRM